MYLMQPAPMAPGPFSSEGISRETIACKVLRSFAVKTFGETGDVDRAEKEATGMKEQARVAAAPESSSRRLTKWPCARVVIFLGRAVWRLLIALPEMRRDDDTTVSNRIGRDRRSLRSSGLVGETRRSHHHHPASVQKRASGSRPKLRAYGRLLFHNSTTEEWLVIRQEFAGL